MGWWQHQLLAGNLGGRRQSYKSGLGHNPLIALMEPRSGAAERKSENVDTPCFDGRTNWSLGQRRRSQVERTRSSYSTCVYSLHSSTTEQGLSVNDVHGDFPLTLVNSAAAY